ncbi:hypothetical protein Q8791_06345 [Nocardiopsis sp. CT-R113]|uniref:Secreted protein n=1 Tax=Nocardiopsis codii TaxID=3065942 RepID=A0ABU7K3L9_9ACTN|nr:hypothetical protein [Nocardiopsis sp. CT-R113]MEE2036840.1 hypothetical protein [Nocardiopsis sp. CT-R113]
MTGHLHARSQRTFVVLLVSLVVMCFLCALCHGTPFGSRTAPVSTVTAPVVSAQDCPDGDEGIGGADAADGTVTAGGPAPDHTCDPADGQGLPTAQPLLPALGAALTPPALLAPRAGPRPRPARPAPSAPHGHGLLTLLCVRRV